VHLFSLLIGTAKLQQRSQTDKKTGRNFRRPGSQPFFCEKGRGTGSSDKNVQKRPRNLQ